MSTSQVQATYADLDALKRQVINLEAIAGEIKQSLSTQRNALNGEWIGFGGDAFMHEMDDEIFPAIQRLQNALRSLEGMLDSVAQGLQTTEHEESMQINNLGLQTGQTNGLEPVIAVNGSAYGSITFQEQPTTGEMTGMSGEPHESITFNGSPLTPAQAGSFSGADGDDFGSITYAEGDSPLDQVPPTGIDGSPYETITFNESPISPTETEEFIATDGDDFGSITYAEGTSPLDQAPLTGIDGSPHGSITYNENPLTGIDGSLYESIIFNDLPEADEEGL